MREASALRWMIQMLPDEDEVIAALCAVGHLPAGDHHAYFYSKNMASPLMQNDIQTALEVTLESIVGRLGATKDATTVVNLLRAYVGVSVRRPKLSDTAKQFLATSVDFTAYGLEHISAFICSNAVKTDQDVRPDVQWTIGRLAMTACEMSEPRHWISIASAIQSNIQEDKVYRRKSGDIDDTWLAVVIRRDSALLNASRCFRVFTMDETEISGYCAAAKQAESVLSWELQSQLRFITTPNFLASNLSAGDLDIIGGLFSRTNPEGLYCIRPVVLRHLLYHFEHKGLKVLPDTVLWVQAAFQLSRKHIERTLVLWRYLPAELILPGSHLSLLRPVTISQPQLHPNRRVQDGRAHTTEVRSPWSQVLSIMPIPDTAEIVSEIACTYCILLLAMYRHGFTARAQVMLRELLPLERGIMMMAHGTRSRHHLALHARVIDVSLWEQLADGLLQPTEDATWTACENYPAARAFVDAISDKDDCSQCPHDETEIEPGWAALLTSASEPKPEEVNEDIVLPVITAAAPVSASAESPDAVEEQITHTHLVV